jgi:hypothetical protein
MWIFSMDLHKIPSIPNFAEVPPAAAELIVYVWAQGHADVTKLMEAFRGYEKGRKTLIFTSHDIFCHFILLHLISISIQNTSNFMQVLCELTCL